MNSIFQQNSLNTIVFKLQVILLIMEIIMESQKVAIIPLAIRLDSEVIHHVAAMEKVAYFNKML